MYSYTYLYFALSINNLLHSILAIRSPYALAIGLAAGILNAIRISNKLNVLKRMHLWIRPLRLTSASLNTSVQRHTIIYKYGYTVHI